MRVPRIVIAGTTSGVGKTSITCSIIHAMQKKGLSVQPFKVGPDYIDPAYLSSVSGNRTYNLDAWLMGRDQLLKSFVLRSKSDVSVIEGVMGYYDGFEGSSNYASTHHIAALTESHVILVLDASKTSRSIAATVLGFLKFHRNSRISGIILNKIGSKKHEALCRAALQRIGVPIIGIIPKDPILEMPSRHLGLISTLGQKALKRQVARVSEILSRGMDVDKIIKMAKNSPHLAKRAEHAHKKTTARIAVALDTSFNFYYQDNLNALSREGAKLKFFSPVRDKKIPECDGLYIGGGFPEVLGDLLEKNKTMMRSIKKLSEANTPIYAECGGLMYLTKSILSGGKRYKMAGVFDADTLMTDRMILNYTRGRIISKNPIAHRPRNFKGHEFHYSRLDSVSPDLRFSHTLETGQGIQDRKDGLIQDNTLASYGHLYFDSSNHAKVFVKNCTEFSKR